MKTTSKNLATAILVTLLFSIANAQAAIISGDFRTESDLPYCCASGGPLVYENIGAPVGPGAELTDADFVENPTGWGGGVVHLDLDPLTNILTLDSQDTWDFEIFDAWITNISFDTNEVITGLSWISGNITDLGLTPILAFSGDSIHIRYDVGFGNPVFNFTGTQMQFQINTEISSVPIPGAALLFGSGLIGLFSLRQRRKKAPRM